MREAAIDPGQLAEWQSAVGRTEVREQVLSREDLRRYALAVGCPGDDERPPLAHWAFFLPEPTDDEIGADGHPLRGGFLPPVTLPRRMFAAAEIEFSAPLVPESPARMTSTIAEVSHKAGRSGDLVFVVVERVLSQEDETRVRERQTFVYRGHGPAPEMPRPARPVPDGEVWQPTEVNLFRYSAATFNGHRIHYDRRYATEVEGYPALVVHGPFTAARLAALAMREGGLAGFSFRATAPLFLGQPIYMRRADADTFQAVRCDGASAMHAEVRFA